MAMKLVSKSQFADLAGVTPAAVTKACRGCLKPAIHGKRIDAAHVAALEYLKTPRPKMTKRPRKTLPPPPEPVRIDEDLIGIPEDIQEFADMTLREIIDKFGTSQRFSDWLTATKTIEAINTIRLKNAETEGRLISRSVVKTGIINPVEAAHLKLLTDGSKTIAVRVVALHEAGRDIADIEKWVSKQITSFIKPMKAKTARVLRSVSKD